MDAQGEVTLGISICHAAHKPERKPTLNKMLEALKGQSVHVEDKPGKPHEWSERQWRYAVSLGCTHAVLLNDDVVLCEDFVEVLTKVIQAKPGHVINLYNTHHYAHQAYAGGKRWLTSPEGLIGIAYALPTSSLVEFLEWRETALMPGTVEVLSEDQLLNLWVMSKHALVWHTVPALVDHDTGVQSCYGNVQLRKPEVGPKPGMIELDWNTDGVHQGRQFQGNHWSLIRFMKPEYRDVERAYLIHCDVVRP